MMKGGKSRASKARPVESPVREVSTAIPEPPSTTNQAEPANQLFPSDDVDEFEGVLVPEQADFMYSYLRDRWAKLSTHLKQFGISKTADELFLESRKRWFDANFGGKVDPNLLEKPGYVYTAEQLSAIEFDPPAYVNIIKNSIQKWSIDNELFSGEFIDKKYGQYITDIRVQTPLVEGFNMRNSKYTQEIGEMLVCDYIKYQKSKKSMYLLDKNSLDDKINFAVNLDIGNFPEQLTELYNRVPSWLYCNKPEDLQGMLRKHIPGMSVPQIYLKVAGCWTGGHQENLSLRAVNINHGPGEVEWYCMEADEAYRFNKQIMKDKQLNLLKLEGLWYIPLEEVLKRGFKVSKFVQEEGDTVVLAPGTLHWVRSYGHTVNSAWNIGEYSYLQIDQLFKRYDFNLEYQFRNLIPVKTLTLDIVNYCAGRINEQTFELLKDRLIGFLNQSLEVLAEAKKRKLEVELDNNEINNMVMCSKCYGETFESWYYSLLPNQEQFDIESILCHKCAFDISTEHRLLMFIKYDHKQIQKFLDKLVVSTHKNWCSEKTPVFPKFSSSKFYIHSTISEYFVLNSKNELVPINTDDMLNEDPMTIIKYRQYLSRKSTSLNQNTISADFLSYKIKRKRNPEEDLLGKRSPNNPDAPAVVGNAQLAEQPPAESVPPTTQTMLKAMQSFFNDEEINLELSHAELEAYYQEFCLQVKSQAGDVSMYKGMLCDQIVLGDWIGPKQKLATLGQLENTSEGGHSKIEGETIDSPVRTGSFPRASESPETQHLTGDPVIKDLLNEAELDSVLEQPADYSLIRNTIMSVIMLLFGHLDQEEGKFCKVELTELKDQRLLKLTKKVLDTLRQAVA